MEHFEKKITQLRQIIADHVKPLLGKRVIIADAPYYANIGDTLIWQGAVDFLHENGFKLLGSYGAGYFPFPNLDKDVTIILTGGGNFGDLWRVFQDIRLEIIKRYPENRIVMLPQSICYQEIGLINKDADLMARHNDLHLFARDQVSYGILSAHFNRNHLYLAPDMAFYISPRLLTRHRNREEGKTLFLLRSDKELRKDAPTVLHEAEVTTDWKKSERFRVKIYGFRVARRISRELRHYGIGAGFMDRAIEFMGNRIFRESLTRNGCEFLRPFSRVVTTRLHTMILSVLLHKPVEYIDNTYGKLSAFADTWLQDLPEVRVYGVAPSPSEMRDDNTRAPLPLKCL
ncbi:hypothetical protein HDR70_07000 [bacterium]|nr:hypothetical protein [bacterium]